PPPRVGDEETDEKSSKGAKDQPAPETTLDREASSTNHRVLVELYGEVAKPHDLVALKRKDGRWHVQPVPQFLGPTSKAKGSISLRRYNDGWKLGSPLTVDAQEITGYEPYEAIALFKVDNFLGKGLDKLP